MATQYIPSVVIEATGLLHVEDLEALKDELCPPERHVEQWIGIGCSWKRLADPRIGGINSPPVERLRLMMGVKIKNAHLCLHYSPRTQDTAATEIAQMVSLVPEARSVRALQVNGGISDRKTWGQIRAALPMCLLVAQLPVYKMTDAEIELWFECCYHSTPFDGVLIDGSGGKGSGQSRRRVSGWAEEAAKRLGDVLIGVAGGYTPQELRTLHLPFNGKSTLIDCTTGVRINGVFSCQRALEWFASGQEAASRRVEIKGSSSHG